MPCVMVPGLGEEEAAELDRKLQLLDSVLEKEVGELPVVVSVPDPIPCQMRSWNETSVHVSVLFFSLPLDRGN